MPHQLRVCCLSLRHNKSRVLKLELLCISTKIMNYVGIMNISQGAQLALKSYDSKRLHIQRKAICYKVWNAENIK
jgi:hypothetical protein